jgi:hypothetical protein
MVDRDAISEILQRMVAGLVATQPAGAGLCLVGGFRYRMLDRGPRRSVDIDFHWHGDLVAKQRELIALLGRRLLPEVRRLHGLDGSVAAGSMPDESEAVAVVDLAFWRLGSDLGRIEIPVDVTRLELADAPIVRTADGVVYCTVSDADMLESKVLAILMRPFLEHRDLLDLFLFSSHASGEIRTRLATKRQLLRLGGDVVERRLKDLKIAAKRHAKAVDAVIREQVDPPTAFALSTNGGGHVVLESATQLLTEICGGAGAETP